MLLDKIISYFAPAWALERSKARTAAAIMERHYEAAGYGRRLKNWRASSTSANQELGFALVTLRNRSRDLCRNNPWGKRAVQCIANNTVGSGLMPSILNVTPKVEKKVKKLFYDWAKHCDFDTDRSLWFLQKLIMRSECESGDCLIVKKYIRDDKAKVRLKIQVLEADHLDHSRDGGRDKDGSFIRWGIKFSKEGRRLGYWLYPSHPGEGSYSGGTESVFVPAKDVIHVYEVLRPGQVRGVPRGVSVFVRMKDLDDYEDAQLVRQKIAACYTVFVSRPTDHGAIGSAEEEDMLERIEPGLIEYLAPGEEVSFANPPSTQGFTDYTRNVKQAIAAGFGITYEALTGDYSQVNFSSGRMGWIEMSRNIRDLQENVLMPAMDTIWEWFMEAAILEGKIATEYECEWTRPRREMIDPKSEIAALNAAVRNGFMSWEEAVRSLGYDPDDVLREIANGNAKFDELKIILDSDPRQDKPAAQPPPEEAEEEAEEQEEEQEDTE